jgi:hypothetical protein
VEGSFVPDWVPEKPFDRPPVAAAVLIGLVQRPDGLSVLYTERSPALRSHSGQVAIRLLVASQYWSFDDPATHAHRFVRL